MQHLSLDILLVAIWYVSVSHDLRNFSAVNLTHALAFLIILRSIYVRHLVTLLHALMMTPERCCTFNNTSYRKEFVGNVYCCNGSGLHSLDASHQVVSYMSFLSFGILTMASETCAKLIAKVVYHQEVMILNIIGNVRKSPSNVMAATQLHQLPRLLMHR